LHTTIGCQRGALKLGDASVAAAAAAAAAITTATAAAVPVAAVIRLPSQATSRR